MNSLRIFFKVYSHSNAFQGHNGAKMTGYPHEPPTNYLLYIKAELNVELDEWRDSCCFSAHK